ncbi:hypothetical protein EDB19DRAFT_1927704 [Suillus lakei]|nr:hypothetical protein EDB19DRAFT_1927704 [Suillus lakei]
MRLRFSTDHVRNSIITNEQGQVLYKVITPFRPFFMKGTSTIWKIIPNTHLDDTNVTPVAEDIHIIQSDGDGEEEEIILDMQDQFQTSRIRWFGLNSLGQGEVSTKEFIPSPHVFSLDPDDRIYRWHLGMRVCKLYLESEPKKPVAQYHRYSTGLLPGKRPRCGFLDINLPMSKVQGYCDENDTNNYTDYELEHILDRYMISPELLDTIIVTFIYVEKLRREREQGTKKDMRWNY